MLTLVLPTKFWYRAAYRTSRLLAPFASSSPPEPHILNRILGFMTRTQRPFPIPWKAIGREVLFNTGNPGGVVLCSAHVPLIKVAARAIMEMGYGPTAAIASHPGADGCIGLPGLTERLPVFKTSPTVLLTTRTTLKQRGAVLLLVDTKLGEAYSPNILRLARRTGARVVFFFAKLQPDGHIEVSFKNPPDPFCTSEESIQANLQFLDGEVHRILRAE
jgi:hypothetical protein